MTDTKSEVIELVEKLSDEKILCKIDSFIMGMLTQHQMEEGSYSYKENNYIGQEQGEMNMEEVFVCFNDKDEKLAFFTNEEDAEQFAQGRQTEETENKSPEPRENEK